MPTGFDFKKLRRLVTIHTVIQIALVGLLIYMAMLFQGALHAEGRGFRFIHSIISSLVIQMILFYPINKFAIREAKLAADGAAIGLTPDEMKSQRNKRLIGDVLKSGVFCFFLIFAWRAPSDRFFLCIISFTFLLTYLSYFQCFNFAAKREMKERP